MPEFEGFEKIPRLKRGMIVTEKIDGTNAQIYIGEDGEFAVGSRKRWITPEADNFGFAKWAYEHKDELMKLGPGRHFGEWWGSGIQRRYGLDEKRFSLFNTSRWVDNPELPECCGIVPILAACDFDTNKIDEIMADLKANGSKAAPGFMNPEGVIIYLVQARRLFKYTFDDKHKG